MTAAVRMAFDVRKLAIAAAGVLLLQLGARSLAAVFPADAAGARFDPFTTTRAFPIAAEPDGLAGRAVGLAQRLLEPGRLLAGTLVALLDAGSGWPGTLHALLALAWMLVVGGLCGGAIARIAIVQEATRGQTGVVQAVRFALKEATNLILTPLCPLLALLLCALVGAAFGWLYRVPGGSMIAGVLLIVPLAAGLVMTLLAAALVAGWPLFHAAVAAGADDALDALSRVVSYLTQRLVLVVAWIAIALPAGIVGLVLVDLFASSLIALTEWSLSLSGGRSVMAAFAAAGNPDVRSASAAVHRFWMGAIGLVAHAWVYSFFWTAAALLYLWLRYEVDGTPPTEVDRPGPTAMTAAAPPPVASVPAATGTDRIEAEVAPLGEVNRHESS